MVNPTRRATLEDVISHWWVNWGYATRVGQQEALQEAGHPGSDSGRASMADWLRRSSRPLLENGAKVCSFFKQHAPGGGSVAPSLERQHSLKKSRKENDMAQSLQGDPADGTSPRPGKGNLKLPKGILKKKDSASSEWAGEDPELSPAPASPGQAAPLLPKKSILKKSRQRESGYYSSPEPSESGELLDAGDVFMSGDSAEQKPPPASGLLLHRKGILKHNGKFSCTALHLTAPTTFGSLNELAAPHPPPRASRPSGAVSEDSILSSESFDQLDLPEWLPDPLLRGCVSVDNLKGLEEPPSEGPGSRGLRRWRQDPLGESCISLTDCPEVTQAYRRALGVCPKLS